MTKSSRSWWLEFVVVGRWAGEATGSAGCDSAAGQATLTPSQAAPKVKCGSRPDPHW